MSETQLTSGGRDGGGGGDGATTHDDEGIRRHPDKPPAPLRCHLICCLPLADGRHSSGLPPLCSNVTLTCLRKSITDRVRLHIKQDASCCSVKLL